VGLLARLVPLWLGLEHYGDAPVRIEAAERWIAHPHLWRGFAEAFQYGPLHLTLLGLSLPLFGRFAGPKLLSLAFGLWGVWLMHRLGRRVAGPAAGLLAGLALALSPLHIQMSTTGASEAVFLALLLASVLLVLDARDGARPLRLLAGALLLSAASLVRYDGPLYAGLLALLLLWDALTALSLRLLAQTLLFAGLSLLLPALWFVQCWRATGDPFAPLRHVNLDHAGLAAAAIRWFGPLKYRLWCLGFWPASLLLVCTPVAGLFAMLGAFRELRRAVRRARALAALSDAQWLAVLAWAPAAYFTLRGALRLDFRPMARFALAAGALSLPFAWPLLRDLAQRAPLALRRATLALGAVALLLTAPALALASYGRDGRLAEWARPLSPISSAPPGVAAAARWLRENAQPADVVLLDGTWHFLDIVLAFASGLPEDRLVRRAWPDFEPKLLRTPPTLAVVLEGGTLSATEGAQGAVVGAPRFTLREQAFCAAAHFSRASIYRRCPPASPSASGQ
jgi:hypothetical protein